MLRKLLDEIAEIKARSHRQLRPAASVDEIADLKIRSKQQFGVDLPDAYLNFLSLANGLTHNGLHLYGATANADDTVFAFVIANLMDRAPDMAEYIFFGSNPPDVFVWNLKNGKFEAASRFSEYAFESFDNCDELLSYALGNCIA